MLKKNKNKVALFLVKEGFNNPEEILDDFENLKFEKIKNGDELIGTLFYLESKRSEPNWLKNFFNINNLEGVNFFNSNTRAVFLVETDGRMFALTFGYGKSLLKNETFEDDFGLFTTLNLVIPDTLRSVDKVNLALSGKKTREQLIKSGDINDFGVDIEQDLVRMVTGKSSAENLGGIITGRDSFHVSIESTFKNIKVFLKRYLDYYKKDDYKKDFAWIDNVRKVEDKKLIEELDGKLIGKIKGNDHDKMWLAVPEIIDWSGIEGFKYKKGDEKIFEDLYLNDFNNYLGDNIGDLTVKKLKHTYNVYCGYDFSKSNFKRWSVYDCIYCEIGHGGNVYVLNNKRWYKINSDFVAQINDRYEAVPRAGFSLPDYKEDDFGGKGGDKGEGGYNKSVSIGDKGFILFDKKNISIGGGHSRVEFCDLYQKVDRRIIHVKIYGNSSVLSHLFNQGLVSGELFLSEREFRDKVNNQFTADCKIASTAERPNSKDYEIVFGIICNDLNLPFFSKISLTNVFRRLDVMGYKVSLLMIKKIKKVY
jgi:uncharacterized protein (TIGR04141 family)